MKAHCVGHGWGGLHLELHGLLVQPQGGHQGIATPKARDVEMQAVMHLHMGINDKLEQKQSSHAQRSVTPRKVLVWEGGRRWKEQQQQ